MHNYSRSAKFHGWFNSSYLRNCITRRNVSIKR